MKQTARGNFDKDSEYKENMRLSLDELYIQIVAEDQESILTKDGIRKKFKAYLKVDIGVFLSLSVFAGAVHFVQRNLFKTTAVNEYYSVILRVIVFFFRIG